MIQRVKAIIERKRQRYEFRHAFENAGDDERSEMIDEYISQNTQDRFINKMERRHYKKVQGWTW